MNPYPANINTACRRLIIGLAGLALARLRLRSSTQDDRRILLYYKQTQAEAKRFVRMSRSAITSEAHSISDMRDLG